MIRCRVGQIADSIRNRIFVLHIFIGLGPYNLFWSAPIEKGVGLGRAGEKKIVGPFFRSIKTSQVVEWRTQPTSSSSTSQVKKRYVVYFFKCILPINLLGMCDYIQSYFLCFHFFPSSSIVVYMFFKNVDQPTKSRILMWCNRPLCKFSTSSYEINL